MGNSKEHFLFFTNNINNENAVFNDIETRHMVNVLRLKEGDVISFTDGCGNIFTGMIEFLNKEKSVVRILAQKRQKRKVIINLFVGIPEKDSFERILPMVIPLGVSNIYPMICNYCQKSWWNHKWEKNIERFNRVALTSNKQCWNAFLPQIHRPLPFDSALEKSKELLLYADINGKSIKGGLGLSGIVNFNCAPQSLDCFVGPPGGFSNNEITALQEKGTGILLSDYRLRTELASSLIISATYQIWNFNDLEK